MLTKTNYYYSVIGSVIDESSRRLASRIPAGTEGASDVSLWNIGWAREWVDTPDKPGKYYNLIQGSRAFDDATSPPRIKQVNTWQDLPAADKREHIRAEAKAQIPNWTIVDVTKGLHDLDIANGAARWQTMNYALAATMDADLDTFDNNLDNYDPDPAFLKLHLPPTSGVDNWAVGSIQMSLLATPPGPLWKLADGSDCTGTAYATATGNNTLPDLRGAYLRMAGQNSTNSAWDGGTLGSWQEDQTAKPDSLAIATHDGHTHNAGSLHYTQHRLNTTSAWTSGDYLDIKPNADSDHTIHTAQINISGSTGSAGAHDHAITGWDEETRPKTYSVNYFIKVDQGIEAYANDLGGGLRPLGGTTSAGLTSWPKDALKQLLKELGIAYSRHDDGTDITRDELIALVPSAHHVQLKEEVPALNWRAPRIVTWLTDHSINVPDLISSDVSALLALVHEHIKQEARRIANTAG